MTHIVHDAHDDAYHMMSHVVIYANWKPRLVSFMGKEMNLSKGPNGCQTWTCFLQVG